MSDDPAADVLEVIRRHARAIRAALAAVDLAYPGGEIITDRMRETIQTLNVDTDQLRYFTTRTET